VVDVRLTAGGRTTLAAPAGHTALLVVQHGRVVVNDEQEATAVALVQLERDGADIRVAAEEDARALLLHGQPLGEPVAAHGPFVMNTAEEIEQAIVDFQSGRMGRLVER
jgi:redox-sensitive bicupin YhaK (pirin superfamily)